MQDDKLVELKPVKGGPRKTVEMLEKHKEAINAINRLLGPLGGEGGSSGIVDVYATVINDDGTVTLNRVELRFATVQEQVDPDSI